MVKRLSLILLIIMLFTGFFVLNKTKNPPVPSKSSAYTVPTAAPVPDITTTIISPNMKKTLVMKEEQTNTSVTHIFSTFTEEDETPIPIFTKKLTSPNTITIPYNTWSPDNKYLFLKESNHGEDSYIVISSSGKPISKESETITVEDLFMAEYKDYKITDITGWASPTLLIINTDNADGSRGPSFWFNVTTMTFIQLSTRFN